MHTSGGPLVKNPPAHAGDTGLVPAFPLEREMAPHPSTLAWEIPWTEEPAGLRFMVSQRHDWVAECAHTGLLAREGMWGQVFLPPEQVCFATTLLKLGGTCSHTHRSLGGSVDLLSLRPLFCTNLYLIHAWHRTLGSQYFAFSAICLFCEPVILCVSVPHILKTQTNINQRDEAKKMKLSLVCSSADGCDTVGKCQHVSAGEWLSKPGHPHSETPLCHHREQVTSTRQRHGRIWKSEAGGALEPTLCGRRSRVKGRALQMRSTFGSAQLERSRGRRWRPSTAQRWRKKKAPQNVRLGTSGWPRG